MVNSLVGPLILMLETMLIDFFTWAAIASIIIFSFSVAIWTTYKYGADDYTKDECDIYGYFDRYPHPHPLLSYRA